MVFPRYSSAKPRGVRIYETAFSMPDGMTVSVRSYGNTRNSAQRSAWRKLLEKAGTTRGAIVLSTTFVPQDKR